MEKKVSATAAVHAPNKMYKDGEKASATAAAVQALNKMYKDGEKVSATAAVQAPIKMYKDGEKDSATAAVHAPNKMYKDGEKASDTAAVQAPPQTSGGSLRGPFELLVRRLNGVLCTHGSAPPFKACMKCAMCIWCLSYLPFASEQCTGKAWLLCLGILWLLKKWTNQFQSGLLCLL